MVVLVTSLFNHGMLRVATWRCCFPKLVVISDAEEVPFGAKIIGTGR